jgi:hypothetical protein
MGKIEASDLGDLPQRHGIHTITQTTRGRAIREDVAQVGVTSVADSFDALQKCRPVKPVGNDILLDGLCEVKDGQPVYDSNFSDASNRTVTAPDFKCPRQRNLWVTDTVEWCWEGRIVYPAPAIRRIRGRLAPVPGQIKFRESLPPGRFARIAGHLEKAAPD